MNFNWNRAQAPPDWPNHFPGLEWGKIDPDNFTPEQYECLIDWGKRAINSWFARTPTQFESQSSESPESPTAAPAASSLALASSSLAPADLSPAPNATAAAPFIQLQTSLALAASAQLASDAASPSSGLATAGGKPPASSESAASSSNPGAAPQRQAALGPTLRPRPGASGLRNAIKDCSFLAETQFLRAIPELEPLLVDVR